MIEMMTYSGKKLDLGNLKTENISSLDIARSLSGTCRFNGQTKHHYSVAQHSIIVGNLTAHFSKEEEKIRMFHLGILHDAHETYIGDITKPASSLIEESVPGFKKEIEKIKLKIDKRIYEKYKIAPPARKEKALIKKCDVMAGTMELITVVPGGNNFFNLKFPEDMEDEILYFLGPIDAQTIEAEFLHVLAGIN